MISNRYQHIYFFILLVATFVLMYLVVRPYIVAMFVATVCYVIFKQYHESIESKVKSRNLSSLISTLSVVLLIILPLFIISILVFYEARDLYAHLSVSDTSSGILSRSVARIEGELQAYIPGLTIDFQTYVRAGLNGLISHTGSIFTGFVKFAITLVLMLFALFYLFKDGKSLRSYLIRMSPFDEQDDSNILSRLELTINSVIRGSLIIAVIQGVLTGVGLAIFGVSQPVLWGLVAAFASLIPGVGTAMVSIPAVLFLIFTGNVFGAIGYGVWAILAIGGIDNILSPHLIERRVKIHPFLILISVLGGLTFFGPIGFLAGPIVLAFTVELLKMYPKFLVE